MSANDELSAKRFLSYMVDRDQLLVSLQQLSNIFIDCSFFEENQASDDLQHFLKL